MKQIAAALLTILMLLCMVSCDNGAGTDLPGSISDDMVSAPISSPQAELHPLSVERISNQWVYLTEVEDEKGTVSPVPACYALKNVPYCTAPLDSTVQFVDIYVPAAYVDAVDNGDGTFTCAVSDNGSVTNAAGITYTAATAPVVLQNSIDAYKQSNPIALSDSRRGGGVGTYGDFIESGYILISLACRGSNSKVDGYAPASIVDMKAAIRMLKFNDDFLPGDMSKIITTGGSAGGGVASLLGASGNSELYLPYLEEIGAILDSTDDVFAVAAYCPITNLDVGDAAYEWLHASETKLAPVNHGNGTEQGENAPATMSMDFGPFEMALQQELLDQFDAYLIAHNIDPQVFYDGFLSQINTCIADYITMTDADPADFAREFSYLNFDGEAVTAPDVGTFVENSMARSKGCTSFDTLYLGSNENKLFRKTHFSKMVYDALCNLSKDYADAASYALRYEPYINEEALTVVKIMSPDTFLTGDAESDVAPNWRFRIGTNDGDLGASTAWLMVNLLEQDPAVETIDYALVWGKPHGTADYSFDGIREYIDSICG